MSPIDVAPQVYYDAAKTINRAAKSLMWAFEIQMDGLDGTSGMGGSVGDGAIWAKSYDQQARDLWKTSLDMVIALDSYVVVLNQAGYNHAVADHDQSSSVPEPQLPTLDPACTFSVAQLLCTIPSSAASDGRGLIDDGLELATKVGIPIPDGDTSKMTQAAEAWSGLATHESVTGVATELERAAVMFERVTSPDASFIDEDLRELKTVATELAGAYGEIAQSCRDQKIAHDNLRTDLEKLLEKMAEEIAVEVAVSLALSVLASCVSFGVGAVAVAAKTAASVAKIIDKFVDLIKAAIKLKKLQLAVKVEKLTEKSKATLARIKELTTKLAERLKNLWRKSDVPSPLSPQQAEDKIKVAERVGSGKKADVDHRSASFPVDDIAGKGTVTEIVGGDGRAVTLVQMPGELNGVPGRFEWILDGDKVTHQMFVRNGTINGIPIKK